MICDTSFSFCELGQNVPQFDIDPYVDGRKRERPHYCLIHMHIRTVWLLYNLSSDGKLFLSNGKNAAFVQVHHLFGLT